MKPLSKHIQETLNNEPLKGSFKDKFIEEELDALTRASPVEKTPKAETSSLVDKTISGK